MLGYPERSSFLTSSQPFLQSLPLIFDPLRKLYPKFQQKISIIKGDVSLPNLGMNSSNITLLTEKVNVIFHIAATVKFNEKITVATAINVRGTRDLLTIARRCQHLESFLYVGTAYSYCNRQEIDEIFYQAPISADQLIEMTEKVPEEYLIKETPKLIKPWPNTYNFTKVVAEEAVQKYGKHLPICVVRPAIIIATYKEPLRSWIDNLYGVTGIVIGVGTGVLKTVYCDKKKNADLVPGDYVINTLISAAYKTAIDKNENKITIYNYVSSVENALNWERVMEKCQKWGDEIPYIKEVWCPNLTLNKFYVVHFFYSMIFHFLLALIMDFGLILSRQKPVMWNLYKKIEKFEKSLAYFSTNEWKFHNNNVQSLWNFISSSDKEMFSFSIKNLDWDEYSKTHMLGLRTYLLKDDVSTIPAARKRHQRFRAAEKIIKILLYFLLLYIVYCILSKTMLNSRT